MACTTLFIKQWNGKAVNADQRATLVKKTFLFYSFFSLGKIFVKSVKKYTPKENLQKKKTAYFATCEIKACTTENVTVSN